MPQVLQVLPVPEDVDARQGGPASAGHASTSGAQAACKRKRGKDVQAASDAQTSGQQPDQATAAGAQGDTNADAEGTPGMDAPDQAQWGLRHAAELGEVVRWCEPRIAWEILRLQLKVSQHSLDHCPQVPFHQLQHECI